MTKPTPTNLRLLAVIAAGVLIYIVCEARIALNRPQDFNDQLTAAQAMRPAPAFEALDANNHLVRLSSWLGRHRIIVVFFDGQEGADRNRDLLQLRDHAATLQAMDVKVVGVADALPQENRAAMDRAGGVFPFPLVSDIDPQSTAGTLPIHRRWGRFDAASGRPLTGLFLIDRRGSVAHVGTIPKPYESAQEILNLLEKE